MPDRPSIFQDSASDIDLTGFSPKGESSRGPTVPAATVRQVSAESGFVARTPGRLGRPKTGRTVLLNARITQRAHDRFCAIVEREGQRYEAGELGHRVTLGEVVERALAALERETGP
jgi:hypothetical protein